MGWPQKIAINILLSVVIISAAAAQIRNAHFKIHDRGNLWETMKDDGTIGAPNAMDRYQTYPSMDWPGGPHELRKDEQRSYMVAAGVWIGGRHAGGNLFFTENGPFDRVDRGVFKEITKKENFIDSPTYNPNEAEQLITAEWITTENIRCRRLSRSWSFRGLNNFIILEYTFTNNNPNSVSDVYFGFPALIRPNYQDFVVHNGWGDSEDRADDMVGYDSSRALLYAIDSTSIGGYDWDVGDFWQQEGELRAPGYAGISLLYADPASNGKKQPATVFYAQLLGNSSHFTLSSSSETQLYDILSGRDKSLQLNSRKPIVPFMLLGCGPYTIQPHDSVKIVMVEAVNGVPLEKTFTDLEHYRDTQKILPAGLDSLKNSVDRARKLFNENYHLPSVPPPSPKIEIIPNPVTQTITLSWDPLEQNWVNPISGKSDIKEYIIYRSEHSFAGPYVKVRRRTQIRVNESSDREKWFKADLNKWVYEDKVGLGVSYFYAVTTRDSAGRESWLTNRNEEAVRATRNPAENTLHVNVFPNPFREVSGFPTTGDENLIIWTNLPSVCDIKIYTSSGELVRTLHHNNPDSGEEVWDQLTDSRQRTAPGIYFWTVKSDVGSAKGSLLLIK